MTSCKDFDCAYNYMLTYPALSPGYIIMAGTTKNEGAVISRARDGPANVDLLSEDRWYIAQTNDDHFSGICQERCQAANAHLKEIGKDSISADRLMQEVVFVGPNLNKMTIFSSLMVPHEKRFDALWVNSDYPYVH